MVAESIVAMLQHQNYWISGYSSKWYLIDPDIVTPSNQMEWAMHQLGVLRRNRRTKLKKDHYKRDMTKEQVLANILPKVDLVQWMALSNKNKVSRGKQKEIARSGAKSFAQISDDMAKANGALVKRADVYLEVYCKKDGAVVTPHVQENMNRMDELLTQESMQLQGEPGSGVLWSKDNALP
nr:hypothetical protein CFP56_59764 [Quercus suber]